MGYTEGYKYIKNRNLLVISILRRYISALWRRYSWFESMRVECASLIGVKKPIKREPTR
jgi:hypothetical protein